MTCFLATSLPNGSLPESTKCPKKPCFFCFGLHPRKLTWKWKNHQKPPAEDVSPVFKMVIFHCHLSSFWVYTLSDGQQQPKNLPKQQSSQQLHPTLQPVTNWTHIASPGHPLPTYIVQGSPGPPIWWHFWHKSSENVDEFSTHHQQTWKSSPCNNWTRCFVEYALQII